MCFTLLFFSLSYKMGKAFRDPSLCLAYFLYDVHSRMLLGEKQWSTIQTKTKITKVNAVPSFPTLPVCKAHTSTNICAHNLSLLFMAEVAEAKFKEVMDSYEAIKLERKNESC